jgi:predicted O-methyltransferase YrrM
MSNRTLNLDDRLYHYLLNASLRESDVLRRLRAETAANPRAMMPISPEQGQFMQLLIQLSGARKTLEVGVFTGYSALAVALALPENGKVVACDISEEWTTIARRYWQEAGMADRIDLRLAPAQETLASLIDGESGSFDFAFIDADKANYGVYYEQALQLLKPGGLLAIDNVLWNGDVADPDIHDEDTEAIRALNTKIHADERVTLSLVPIGDGLTLAVKR